MVPGNTNRDGVQDVAQPRLHHIACVGALALMAMIPAAGEQGNPCLSLPSDEVAGRPCVRTAVPLKQSPHLRADTVYDLPALIDLGERASPDGGIAWAHAQAAAEQKRIADAKSLPVVTILGVGADSRDISPFPKPLAPRGYVTVEVPLVNAQLNLEYAVLDFARGPSQRAAADDASAARMLLSRAEQTITYRIEIAYFETQDAEGAMQAAQQNLKTADTLLASSEEQLRNGRATLPDVEHARAGVAQARYQLALARGTVEHSKIALSNEVGAEPSTSYQVRPQSGDAIPSDLEASVDALIAEARRSRPDLLAARVETEARGEDVRKARSAYLPTIGIKADGGQTAVWPSVDYGTLGAANVTTWHATAQLKWAIFDASRSHQVGESAAGLIASQQRERLVDDSLVRQVWDAYTDFKTALEQLRDARQFLSSAEISYSSSADAYRYGVRSLVDVVQSEKDLEDARFAVVHSQTMVLTGAAAVHYAIGMTTSTSAKGPGQTP